MTIVGGELVWVYRRHRRQWIDEWRRGERPSDFFYGLVSLSARYRVGFVEDDGANHLRPVWRPIERVFARSVGIGFALDVAVRHLRALNRAGAVIATVDTCGLPLAWLRRLGLLRRPLIYISQGLSDRVSAYGATRPLARWMRRVVRSADELATLSAGAAAGLADWLGVPSARVHVLPFGVDHEFWRNVDAAADEYVISVGSDPGRDYATLLAASGELPLHIVTRQPLAIDGRPSITRTSNQSDVELRALYSGARFAVIPLLDRDQPGGQSAALQAMACGTPVIISRTRGWWGETFLKDGDNCVVVPAADPGALGRAMRELWAAPDECRRMGAHARATVVEHFGEPRFAAALAATVEPHLPPSPAARPWTRQMTS